MLVQCGHCGAPLEVELGQTLATCKYCNELQSIGAMQTLAAQTPVAWAPPPIWTPPPHARIGRAEPLRYRPPPRPRGSGARGCFVALAVLGLLGAGVTALVIGPAHFLRVLSGGGDAPPTLAPRFVVPASGLPRRTFSGTTGGSGSRTMDGPGCTFGDYVDAPQLTFTTSAPQLVLLDAVSRDDVTVAVALSTGGAICDDDSGEGTNAHLALGLPAGTHSVWVGRRDDGIPFDLTMAARPIAAMPDAHGLVAAGPALLGALDVDHLPAGGHFLVHVEPEVEVETYCAAKTTAVPTLVLRTAQPRGATVRVSGPHDPALVVSDASGTFTCDDDGGDEGEDSLERIVLAPGATAIWAGFRNGDEASDMLLDVHVLPPGVVPDATGLAPTSPAAWTTLDLDAVAAAPAGAHDTGLARVATAEGVVDADVDGQRLGADCRGRYAVQPSVVLKTTVARHVVLTTTGTGDLVMAARVGDVVSCDDDSGGAEMARLALDLTPGLFPVWVGAFHGGGALPAGLSVEVGP